MTAEEGGKTDWFVIGTLFAADVNDREDANLYGAHPVYLDTRYYTTTTLDDGNGPTVLQYAPDPSDTTKEYVSYTHGVFLRNDHAQEVLLRPGGLTWRTLGGSIDLYFFSGPSAKEVMASYQTTTVGLPARQQYWTLGFHQCRWGYGSWGELQEVVDGYEGAGIPLETIWSELAFCRVVDGPIYPGLILVYIHMDPNFTSPFPRPRFWFLPCPFSPPISPPPPR